MARLRYLQNARTGTAGTISKDTKPIQFYDDAMYIYASADGVLEIVSDTTLTLTAPTINLTSSTVTAYTYPITITFNCTALSVSDLTITSVSSSTSGSVVIKPLYVDATMSATGGLGRAIEGKLTVSGKLGDYGNAIKGYTDLTSGTGCAGLVSAICAEMKMPATTALGTHAVLEIELVMPTSAVIQQGIGANCTSFIRARVSDNSAAVASFNEYGYFLDLQGLTSGSTDLFDGCTLKCAISSTKYYLLLSTATASFTTAYPIVLTNATAAITIATGATGIDMTGPYTVAGINITSTVTTAGDYGILVTDTYTKVDGSHNAINGVTIYDPAVEGYGWINAIAAKMQLAAGKEFDGGQGGLYGGQFQLDLATSCILDEATSTFAGVRGVITGTTPVCTNFSVIACGYFDNLCTGDLTGGQYGSSLIAIHNHGSAIDHAIQIFAANATNTVTNFLHIVGDTQSLVSAGAVGTTGAAKLRVLWGSTTYYINMYQS